MSTLFEVHQQPLAAGGTALVSVISSSPQIQKAVHNSKENDALSWRG